MKIKTYINDDLERRPCSTKKLAFAIQQQCETLDAIREQMRDDPSTLNRSHLGRAVGRLSDHMWLDGRDKRALELGEEARQIWEDLGRDKAEFLQRLHLADYRGAIPELESLVDEAHDSDVSVYEDFALEALARHRYHAGECDRALDAIERALDIRRERGNDFQIERTMRIHETIESATRKGAERSDA